MIPGRDSVLWHSCFSGSGHACWTEKIASTRSSLHLKALAVMVRLNTPEDRDPQDRAARARSAGPLNPLVIRSTGDMTSCEQVGQLFQRCRRTIIAAGIAAGRRSVTLDLLEVAKADTKLVACLVAVYQLSKDSSVRLEMRASRTVLELVELCRLQRLIDQTAPAG